jgi:hypothetical protein
VRSRSNSHSKALRNSIDRASAHAAWSFISGGFAVGAVIYYTTSLFLDRKGVAIRYPTRFYEYALGRKHKVAEEKNQATRQM